MIIVLGHDDNDTLAAALASATVNHTAHVVAYFEQQSFADLLMAHCPRAEAMVSMSMEIMVRSSQDPGSSRVHQDLLSVTKGQTQFSMRVPASAPDLRYGKLFSMLKEVHNATLVAVAEDTFGKGLELNAPGNHPVAPGAIIYYIAAERIGPEKVNWPMFA